MNRETSQQSTSEQPGIAIKIPVLPDGRCFYNSLVTCLFYQAAFSENEAAKQKAMSALNKIFNLSLINTPDTPINQELNTYIGVFKTGQLTLDDIAHIGAQAKKLYAEYLIQKIQTSNDHRSLDLDHCKQIFTGNENTDNHMLFRAIRTHGGSQDYNSDKEDYFRCVAEGNGLTNREDITTKDIFNIPCKIYTEIPNNQQEFLANQINVLFHIQEYRPHFDALISRNLHERAIEHWRNLLQVPEIPAPIENNNQNQVFQPTDYDEKSPLLRDNNNNNNVSQNQSWLCCEIPTISTLLQLPQTFYVKGKVLIGRY